MIQIKINVDKEKILRLQYAFTGRPSPLQDTVFSVIKEIAEKIYNDLWNDESIPRKWRESLKIALNEPDEVLIGPVWELALLKEKGSTTAWKLYRCPAQKYWGGTIKKGEEGKEYLRRYWIEHRDEIISMLTKSLRDNIVRLLGG